MPTLIPYTDFTGEKPNRDPRLYFKKASYSRYSDRWHWEFKVEEEYPYVANIHRDVINDEFGDTDHGLFVDLRRWVERTAAGDIIFQYKNMSHKWWWNKEATSSYERKYSDIQHGYWYFYFESEIDLSMFTVMHGEKLSKPQKYHPSYATEILKDEEKHDPRYY